MSRFVRSHRVRKIFLDRLACGDSQSTAAMAAGAKVSNFKAWRNTDPDFASDWDDAVEEGTDFLEDAAFERAVTKSDQLAMFMLKARRPEKYDRGSKLELSGGISVEGSKSKLLNKIARLQAAGSLSSARSEGERALLEDEETEAQATPLLPAPDTPRVERGGKRRRATQPNR